jgi:DNA-binding NtrC family response regulator
MAAAEEKILVADDEVYTLEALVALLEADGYALETATNGAVALKKLMDFPFALVLADLKMPELDGLELLTEIKQADLLTEVIIITGKGSIHTAVTAMKNGAYDYLTKPVEADRLRSIVPKALEHHRLLVSYRHLETQLRNLTRYESLIGQSAQMKEVYKTIDAVADSTANVVITGESGTGKELVARAIHNKSNRASGPFIAVNCAAFPREILENELFGHEAGAFTGALKEKAGYFELANGGTIFLDEVGEMPLEIQSKFLRVVEERKFRRLGGKKEISVDIRIISATNRNLNQALEDKSLREDLYYRLCVVEIEMPPLRDRLGDIELLALDFLKFFSAKNKKPVKNISPKCLISLAQYSWPGNVRELKNVIERAIILTHSDALDVTDLPARIVDARPDSRILNIPLGTSLDECEKEIILRSLDYVQNNKTHAAKMFGISLKTLHNKLNQYKFKS